MVSWQDVAADFEADGSLRDIVVIDATVDEWGLVFERLRAERPDPGYLRGSAPAPVPASIAQVAAGTQRQPASFTFGMARLAVVWHWFAPDDVQLTIDPGDLAGEQDLRVLVGFLQQLGRRTGKHVVLTPEGWDQSLILSYDPGADLVRHHPPAAS